MNLEFFRLINDLANKNTFIDKIMIFFSKDMPYIFMAVTAIIFILGMINNKIEYRKVALNTIVLTSINLVISFIVGSIYYVDRPFVHNKVNLLFRHTSDASFPSDHATGTMSIALGLKNYSKLLSVILTILSVIVGFSRVYVGHHYPLDIIGAYIIVFITNYIYNIKLRDMIGSLYERIENKILVKFKSKKLYNN
ncbi:undecaprenyl-diphosphatase [Clostridium sp. 'White wine YQ']|uniref:undecaprenyl-diphosphatase n=1 Tax=Clostridium sp. 'White wine YQ' TaxID=3027474 RepID=UPI002365BD31|nr:undecaprenyl-diphosphatase [Clostridium sp. 'White wine YQ']MDD7795884.1 undecaprenyl-diphosphatase [Clostridium sp. 'White wine YQ']